MVADQQTILRTRRNEHQGAEDGVRHQEAVRDQAVAAIEAYKSKRAATVSPASINRELSCLSNMFRRAIDWKLAEANPVLGVRRFKERNVRVRYLSTDEETKLLGECARHLRPIVVLAIHTGMRRGELLSLRWDDVDLDNRLVHVEDTKNGKRRDIPLNRIALQTLRRHPHHIRSEFVFCNLQGHPYKSVRTGFSAACRRAKVQGVVFHTLRHTFASRLVVGGVDLVTLKELLGHSSLDMVLRYAHLSPEHGRKAVEVLETPLDRPGVHIGVHSERKSGQKRENT